MKPKQLNSTRRDFLGAMVLGAAASGISAFANPLEKTIPKVDAKKISESDKWFDRIKGSHRVVFDGSTPHHSFPVIWNWAWYYTNNGSGSPDDDLTGMTVLRHDAIPFALKDEAWKKYKLGEMFDIPDNNTKASAVRNVVYEPQEKDMPMPVIEGIKKLQSRGAMFCVCDLALNVYSGMAAQKLDMDATEVYEEWKSAVLPDIHIVPSGVWALTRAQEHGCSYIFAG
ncbi:Tat (twin-arginine translocation) pathway signal sequence containing protein [Gramella lutea]|uniref:Tat (Twin-arginine translocation) pathway signal sequence containing protein n=1 Tax=Christiangramia lutea TaxID=1607951 RepID=A0A9X2AC93_9FLAO|nr:Tat (twin-arginine translocation) pathway signal sequence containing protein [Christiangramia lutea]MCH4824232.1 Tat (twin-arginine translocation) pathway signal sequence containing protein [Christiangramia lutea]